MINQQGLLFISVNDSVSQFISQLLGLHCTIVGYYYTTVINGKAIQYTYMRDLKTGTVPTWFESGKPLSNLVYKDIMEIYLIPFKNDIEKEVFQQFQLEFLRVCNSFWFLPDIFIDMINKICKQGPNQIEYLDLSNLYEKESNSLWKRFSQMIGYTCNCEIKLTTQYFEPMILYRQNKIVKVFDKNLVREWIKTRIDELFVDETILQTLQTKRNEKNSENFHIKELQEKIKRADDSLTLDLNKMWKSMGIPELEGEYSVPIIGVVTNKKSHELQLLFENGNYEIITSRFPNLSRFSLDDLHEILLALDVSGDNKEFEQVRLEIVERIISLNSV